MIVDNRGGNAIIPAQVVVQAPADGYTLLFYGAPIWLNALLQDNGPYEVMKDSAPITLAASTPNIIVVNPSLPVRTFRELIALAKARPGEINYGSGVTGSTNVIGNQPESLIRAVCYAKLNAADCWRRIVSTIAVSVRGRGWPDAGRHAAARPPDNRTGRSGGAGR